MKRAALKRENTHDIIHRILIGEIPKEMTLETLRNPIPDIWKEQRLLYFGEEHKK